MNAFCLTRAAQATGQKRAKECPANGLPLAPLRSGVLIYKKEVHGELRFKVEHRLYECIFRSDFKEGVSRISATSLCILW